MTLEGDQYWQNPQALVLKHIFSSVSVARQMGVRIVLGNGEEEGPEACEGPGRLLSLGHGEGEIGMEGMTTA